MKLNVSGNINQYYVQTLCMIFFPGEKFSDGANERDDGTAIPEISLTLEENEEGVKVFASLSLDEKHSSCEKIYPNRDDITRDRLKKIAVGDAILSVCGEVVGYRPSWGMLVGVRPSKVATEMLEGGMSKTRVKKTLVSDYFVIPKKAALATEVALNEGELVKSASSKECSVYISIPFCPTRCAYCSFVSYTSKKLLATIPDYLVALGDEINKTFSLIRELGLRVKIILISPRSDRSAARAYTDRGYATVIPESPAALLRELGSCRLAISIRLHGGIFSLIAGTPCLLSISAQKNRALISEACGRGCPYLSPVNDRDLQAAHPSDSSRLAARAQECLRAASTTEAEKARRQLLDSLAAERAAALDDLFSAPSDY